MSRSSNDDRSDAMNPTSDAYWADQDNRYGGQDDDDGWVDDGNGQGGKQQPRDPHAELRRKLELAYATPESEERDNREARAEFLCWAEEVMTLAAEVATKQHFGGRVLKGDGFVELVLGDGRCVRVADVPEHGLVAIQNQLFGYARKEWRAASKKRDRWGREQEPLTYELADRRSGDNGPHEALQHALEHGDGPTLAELRADVERLTPGDLMRQSDIAVRREAVREAQEKIAALKAKLPPGFENDSWEDTWTPPDERRV